MSIVEIFVISMLYRHHHKLCQQQEHQSCFHHHEHWCNFCHINVVIGTTIINTVSINIVFILMSIGVIFLISIWSLSPSSSSTVQTMLLQLLLSLSPPLCHIYVTIVTTTIINTANIVTTDVVIITSIVIIFVI